MFTILDRAIWICCGLFIDSPTPKDKSPSPINGGDELLQTGGDGDQATSEGHNVPPADGLRFIQVHSDQQLTFDIALQAKRCRKWGR